MTQHANPNIPAWVYHPSESAKIVRSETDLESHLADGWSRTPVPQAERVPQPCPSCEQLRIENARLQSELSALIAAQMNLPRTEAVSPGEGMPTVYVEATAEEIERLAGQSKAYVEATVESVDLEEWKRAENGTIRPIVHPSIPTVQIYPEAPAMSEVPVVSAAEAAQIAKQLGIEPNKQPEPKKKPASRKTAPQAQPETNGQSD